VAGGLSFPSGVAMDGAGNVFIADSENNRVVELQRSKPAALNFSISRTEIDSPECRKVYRSPRTQNACTSFITGTRDSRAEDIAVENQWGQVGDLCIRDIQPLEC
jgi:hypothetical protein